MDTGGFDIESFSDYVFDEDRFGVIVVGADRYLTERACRMDDSAIPHIDGDVIDLAPLIRIKHQVTWLCFGETDPEPPGSKLPRRTVKADA